MLLQVAAGLTCSRLRGVPNLSSLSVAPKELLDMLPQTFASIRFRFRGQQNMTYQGPSCQYGPRMIAMLSSDTATPGFPFNCTTRQVIMPPYMWSSEHPWKLLSPCDSCTPSFVSQHVTSTKPHSSMTQLAGGRTVLKNVLANTFVA